MNVRKPWMELIISLIAGVIFVFLTWSPIFNGVIHVAKSDILGRVCLGFIMMLILYFICLVTIPRKDDPEFLLRGN
jgi:hypothetical protein